MGRPGFKTRRCSTCNQVQSVERFIGRGKVCIACARWHYQHNAMKRPPKLDSPLFADTIDVAAYSKFLSLPCVLPVPQPLYIPCYQRSRVWIFELPS